MFLSQSSDFFGFAEVAFLETVDKDEAWFLLLPLLPVLNHPMDKDEEVDFIRVEGSLYGGEKAPAIPSKKYTKIPNDLWILISLMATNKLFLRDKILRCNS